MKGYQQFLAELKLAVAEGEQLRRLRLDGRLTEALSALVAQKRHMWYAQTAVSPLFSQVRERYVQAMLLDQLGRTGDARPWYETVAQLTPFDLPYRTAAEARLAGL